jgi:hypothetical protein
MLRCCIQESTEWDSLLSGIEFAYNNSINPSIGFTPYYMLYHQHPNLPPTIGLSELHAASANAAATDFLEENQKIIEKAREFLHAAQRQQSTYANRRRRALEFTADDQVMLSTKHMNLRASSSRKLAAKWIGPFKIIERIGVNAYRLDLPNTMKMHPVFNVSLLKKYEAPSVPREISTPPTPLETPTADTFIVEDIIGRRSRLDPILKQTLIEYKVKWKDYPLHEATWEEAKFLKRNSGKGVRNLISRFDKRN